MYSIKYLGVLSMLMYSGQAFHGNLEAEGPVNYTDHGASWDDQCVDISKQKYQSPIDLPLPGNMDPEYIV